MVQNIADLGGQIRVNQDVTSIEKAGSMESFLVTTPRARYKAKRLVLAVPPGPLASIQGKVIEQIKKERMFNSVQSVEAFRAVATYKNPWWEQGNGSAGLTGMEEFVSHSNGIGYIFPYRGKGADGSSVIQVLYESGYDSRKWMDLYSNVNRTMVTLEVTRALQAMFPGIAVPQPTNIVLKQWNYAWHYQKPGYEFPYVNVSQWAKRPLRGEEVFLVGEAYAPVFRAWCEGALLSAQLALEEGWGIALSGSTDGTMNTVRNKWEELTKNMQL